MCFIVISYVRPMWTSISKILYLFKQCIAINFVFLNKYVVLSNANDLNPFHFFLLSIAIELFLIFKQNLNLSTSLYSIMFVFLHDDRMEFYVLLMTGASETRARPLRHRRHREHHASCASTAAKTCASDWNRAPCPEVRAVPAAVRRARAASVEVWPDRRRRLEPTRPVVRRRRAPPDRRVHPSVAPVIPAANSVWWLKSWSTTGICRRRPVRNSSPTAIRSAHGKLSTSETQYKRIQPFSEWNRLDKSMALRKKTSPWKRKSDARVLNYFRFYFKWLPPIFVEMFPNWSRTI